MQFERIAREAYRRDAEFAEKRRKRKRARNEGQAGV
jgi:hypothetical protein